MKLREEENERRLVFDTKLYINSEKHKLLKFFRRTYFLSHGKQKLQ